MTEKGKFLRRLNEAFAQSDVDFITENVTEDIQWKIVGDQIIKGKDAFVRALKEMASDKPFDMSIDNIITHGTTASVNGTMQGDHTGETKTYAFCDIYRFSSFKNPKIKEITSYVLEEKT